MRAWTDGIGYFCNTGERDEVNVRLMQHTPDGDVWRNNLPPILYLVAKRPLEAHSELVQAYNVPGESYGEGQGSPHTAPGCFP